MGSPLMADDWELYYVTVYYLRYCGNSCINCPFSSYPQCSMYGIVIIKREPLTQMDIFHQFSIFHSYCGWLRNPTFPLFLMVETHQTSWDAYHIPQLVIRISQPSTDSAGSPMKMGHHWKPMIKSGDSVATYPKCGKGNGNEDGNHNLRHI